MEVSHVIVPRGLQSVFNSLLFRNHSTDVFRVPRTGGFKLTCISELSGGLSKKLSFLNSTSQLN